MKGSICKLKFTFCYLQYVFPFSLGFYANMIKEALEKTISEGKVCLTADYAYFSHYFMIISLEPNRKANITLKLK